MPGEGLDQVGGGEVAHAVSGFDGGDAGAMRMWLLPVPAGPIMHRFSAARIHSREAR